jgi:cell division protein FtsZ
MKIRVLGIGNGGSNAVDRMIEEGLRGVDFVAVNTDVHALTLSKTPQLVLIGSRVTKGLGAAGDPDIGAKAAEESSDALYELVSGSDIVFIVARMGGGTGTGGAPVIARIAREAGALTIGLVAVPYTYMGPSLKVALDGIEKLKENVDTLIAIARDRIWGTARRRGRGSLLTRIETIFRTTDDVLRQGIQAISDLITVPGLINLEFEDVRAIIAEGGIDGVGTMAVGHAGGVSKAVTAAERAIASPLLNVTIDGARAILFNVTGGPDLSLSAVEKAAEVIREAAHPAASIMFGAVNDETMKDKIRVTIIAMGFESSAAPEIRRRPGRRPEGSPSLSPMPGSSPSPILTQVRASKSSEETGDAPEPDAISRQPPEQPDPCNPSEHSK